MNDPSQEQAPNDRATTFQAVQGPQPEHYSGEVLLVSAYSLVFILLLAWVASSWRKVTGISARLDDLEHAIAAAAPKPEGKDGPRTEIRDEPRAS